jgi:glycosyltransferase involved in cell wall biosynthesis
MQNLYKPKFTYVIPFRYSQDRILPLRRVVEWLSGYQGVEILIVEQDKVSKIENLTLKANHIFCESDAPFNKAWAYNIAIKRSISPVIVFGDADFIMNPNELIEGLKSLEFADCVIPTSNVVRLNPMETNMDLGSIFNIKRVEPKINMTDGISIFKRESIQRIGGWNEDILGMGFCNKFQDLKVKRMLNYKQMEYTGFHFNHSPIKSDFGLNQRNQQIFDYYNNDSSDLNQHINTTVPKSGLMNKYQI